MNTTFMSFTHKRTRLIQLLLVFTTFLIKKTHAVEGCKPQTAGTPGFEMSLYHYPYTDSTEIGSCFSNDYQTSAFQQGGYQTYGGGLFGTASGIEDISLNIRLTEMCTETMGTLPPNFNYDETFSISNFTMLLTGYFLPKYTGEYVFTLEADDLAYLSFGAGHAFGCCDEENTVSDPGAFDLIVIWNGPDDMSGSTSYTLEEGVYYPIRLLYANRDFHGDLKLTFQDPKGEVFTDFSNHIYQFPDGAGGCPNYVTTSTIPWTGTFTSTITTSVFTTVGSNHIVSTGTLYVVQTPSTDDVASDNDNDEPTTVSSTATATTIYTQGTLDITTTYSTGVDTIQGPDGVITIETTYFVKTPSSKLVTATDSATTTNTTNTGTGTDLNTPTDKPTYTVTATTVYTQGTVGITTTYSTATGVYTGTDGIITTETTYFVETPTPETTVTTVDTHTIHNSYTKEYNTTVISTYYTTADNEDEEEVIETDVDIELPAIDKTTTIVETTTEFGSVTNPTTLTKLTTYISGDEEVIESEVDVELPTVYETVTTRTIVFSPGQVTVTTTVATVTNTYYTYDGEGGEKEVIELTYYVDIPGPTNAAPLYTSAKASSTLAGQFISPSQRRSSTLAGQFFYPSQKPSSTVAGQFISPSQRRSSTLAGQFFYPSQKPSSTVAGVSEFHGSGSSMSYGYFTFIIGVFLATFLF